MFRTQSRFVCKKLIAAHIFLAAHCPVNKTALSAEVGQPHRKTKRTIPDRCLTPICKFTSLWQYRKLERSLAKRSRNCQTFPFFFQIHFTQSKDSFSGYGIVSKERETKILAKFLRGFSTFYRIFRLETFTTPTQK